MSWLFTARLPAAPWAAPGCCARSRPRSGRVRHGCVALSCSLVCRLILSLAQEWVRRVLCRPRSLVVIFPAFFLQLTARFTQRGRRLEVISVFLSVWGLALCPNTRSLLKMRRVHLRRT